MRVVKITHIFMSALIISSLFLLSFSNISMAAMPSASKIQSVTDGLSKPQKVALDLYENIYITEPGNNKVLIYNSIGEYVTSLFGLDNPTAIAVDADGRIFIGNEGRGNVEVYGPDLQKLFALEDGIGQGIFGKPAAMAIDNSTGNVYVVDASADVVKIFDANGNYTGSFGSTGSGDGQFNRPVSIAIDGTAGEILVLDHQLITFGMFGDTIEGARVQVFGMNKAFRRSFGTYGFDEGNLNKPQGVTVDEQGRIYVIDSFFQFIFVFDSNGTYLGKISEPGDPVRSPMGIALGKSWRLFISSLTRYKSDVYRISDGADEAYIEATPRDNDFSAVSVGGSAARTIEVFNLGGIDLNIGTGFFSGPDAAEFSVQNDNCSGQTLTPSQKCTVDLVLSPASAGAKNAIFAIPSDDPDNSTIDILLAGTGNIVPVSIISSPAPVVEGQSITFDGSGSYDADGSIAEYAWDVDNDGTYDYISAVSATQMHTYSQDGEYTVNLRVKDNLGATHVSTALVSVTDTAPTVDFVASPTAGTAPLTVTFTNYSSGYDLPLSFEWDFDSDGSVDSNEVSPMHIYNSNGLYTVTLKVTDADGSVDTLVTADYIDVSPFVYDLTVNFPGTGFGNVSSAPAGLNCDSDCTEQFQPGTVELVPTAAAGSTFTGWSGVCSGAGTGSCFVVLTADTTVEANFDSSCSEEPARIENKTTHMTVQNAVNNAVDNDIVQTHEVTFAEDLVMDTAQTITVKGGFDCSYTDNPGMTSINGDLVINSGTVTLENIILE